MDQISRTQSSDNLWRIPGESATATASLVKAQAAANRFVVVEANVMRSAAGNSMFAEIRAADSTFIGHFSERGVEEELRLESEQQCL